MSQEERQKQAVDFLQGMLSRLGIQAEISVEEVEGGDFKLQLQSENAGRLIGRKGQSLESIELLLNRVMKRNDEDSPWVSVEVDGYATGNSGESGRRSGEHPDNARLRAMTLDAAKEVRRWRNPKKLGPFNPAERRIIHLTLQDDEELVTESEPVPGGGKLKYVIVKVK